MLRGWGDGRGWVWLRLVVAYGGGDGRGGEGVGELIGRVSCGLGGWGWGLLQCSELVLKDFQRKSSAEVGELRQAGDIRQGDRQ